MHRGFSLLEIIVAIGVFALMSGAVISLMLGGVMLSSGSVDRTGAELLSREGLEAVYASKGRWNELVYAETDISGEAGFWNFFPEGTVGRYGKYSRSISFFPVYRGEDGNIAESNDPDARLDVFSKQASVTVRWAGWYGATSTIERSILLTDWNTAVWLQSGYQGGEGQSIWSDPQMYASSDSVVIADPETGRLALTQTSSTTYAMSGELVSSAYDIGPGSYFHILAWEQSIPDGCPDCHITFQVQTVSDQAGIPSSWPAIWSGPKGEEYSGEDPDMFLVSSGTIIHQSHNGDRWIRYKALLHGDGLQTPVLKKVQIYYK